jgi:ketosteroid isomerase-like protein
MEDVMAHQNAEIFRKMTQAMMDGDMATVEASLADDVEWHEIGRAEPIRGKAALAGREPGGAETDYDITYDIHDVLANDDHTIGLGEAVATRNGKTLKYRTAEILHIKDGKVQARWAFSDDTQRIIDFFK